MNDDGYPYNMFYYKGLRLESIINDRIILNSNDKTNDSNRAFNEYFEFIKAHPDVYDNPIKSYVFNEIYYVFTNLNSNGKLDISLLQLFNKELNQWGYNLDSDNSIDKIKNRLINLLLK